MTAIITYLDLIKEYFPEDQLGNALAVLEGESEGVPNAIANTAYPDKPGYKPKPAGAHEEYSIGLFQINTLAWPELAAQYDLFNARANVAAASVIYKLSGWYPWSVARAKGITAGKNYTVEESALANKPVPGSNDEGSSGIFSGGEPPAPGQPPPRPHPQGIVGAVTEAKGVAESALNLLEWSGVNMPALLMRGGLVAVGTVVAMIGTWFTLTSLGG